MANEGEINIEAARGLVSDRVLWPHVRDFLWDFAPQIHESWLQGAAAAGDGTAQEVADLVSRLSSSPRIKRLVLDRLGVTPFFHPFPTDDGSRLALLDGATLGSVAKWLGALAMADGLRRVTDGATVRSLKAGLRGVYPDMFGYTAYFKGLSAGDASPSVADVAATGCALLLSAVPGLPAPLLARFRLKLPKEAVEEASRREAAAPLALSTVLKLLKLKFPEAHLLCCS